MSLNIFSHGKPVYHKDGRRLTNKCLEQWSEKRFAEFCEQHPQINILKRYSSEEEQKTLGDIQIDMGCSRGPINIDVKCRLIRWCDGLLEFNQGNTDLPGWAATLTDQCSAILFIMGPSQWANKPYALWCDWPDLKHHHKDNRRFWAEKNRTSPGNDEEGFWTIPAERLIKDKIAWRWTLLESWLKFGSKTNPGSKLLPLQRNSCPRCRYWNNLYWHDWGVSVSQADIDYMRAKPEPYHFILSRHENTARCDSSEGG